MSSVNDIPDAELIRRVISSANITARQKRSRTVPLWHKVSDHFQPGSTYAAQLCRRFGYDPETQVRV